MTWAMTGREILHQGQFVKKVLRDTVVQPDGATGIYEHIEVSDGVRVVALDEQRRVLMVEDDFYLQRRRCLLLPGGGADGQEPLDAAKRELAEETGYKAESWSLLSVVDPLPAITAARTYLFLATGLRPGTERRDSTEINMATGWWDLASVIDAVRAGRVTEACSATALLLAALELRTS
ncbi:NUDIX domain-containing protein [Streptomyces sp. JJ38]|uniref:NUDIX domain-containing protein n=1 Tax=Streptomyces sp. JJ38 TaxID=2738128 RepID=UPI001C56543B|nr:NUDIX hydrolase [Streptomyces sp. JJ38]MBW1597259.1 NUDIX hydrolase [Streptomyces sp. JJ38]